MKTKITIRRRRRRGFTLMEILLVLAILVILGALVGVGYSRIRNNSMIDAAKAQITNLETAVKTYQIDVGNYPTSLSGLLESGDAPQGKWRGPYLDATQLPLDPWNNEYNYEIVTGEAGDEQFAIYSNGPDRQKGSGDDVQIIR